WQKRRSFSPEELRQQDQTTASRGSPLTKAVKIRDPSFRADVGYRKMFSDPAAPPILIAQVSRDEILKIFDDLTLVLCQDNPDALLETMYWLRSEDAVYRDPHTDST